MIDSNGDHVQVQIDGNKMWVNVNGKCAFRSQNPTSFTLEIDGKHVPQRFTPDQNRLIEGASQDGT